MTRNREETIGVIQNIRAGQCAFASNLTKGLSHTGMDAVRASKTSIVDDPKSAVLLPRKVAQEVVFRVNIEAKCARTKENVEIPKVRKLAKNLL